MFQQFETEDGGTILQYTQAINDLARKLAAITETPRPPVDPQSGVCPDTDMPCQRGCPLFCAGPTDLEWVPEVGDIVRITSADAYGDGTCIVESEVGSIDTVTRVDFSYGGVDGLVDLDDNGLWHPSGLELVRRGA